MIQIFEKHRHLLIPLSLTLITGLVMILPPEVANSLSYRRVSIDEFQFWRFLTANLVHSNTIHWVVNLGGLWILWRLFYDSFSPSRWILVLLALAISNIVLIHLFTPRIVNYVGMSGALHGMIALAFIARNFLAPYVSIIGTGVVIAKVVHENWFQTENSMAELIGRTVAVEAHLFGVAFGILMGAIIRCYQENWFRQLPNS